MNGWREQNNIRHALNGDNILPGQRQRGAVVQQQLCHALHDLALGWGEQVGCHWPHMLSNSSQQRRQHLLQQYLYIVIPAKPPVPYRGILS